MMKTVLYMGGFELPDKNAAAQRVVPIGKLLRENGCQVVFRGITKSNDCCGEFNGFKYGAVKYPQTTTEWIKYAIGVNVIGYIDKLSPSCIILYNYPAIAQERIIRHCHKKGIKVIGDITEWYQPSNFLKKIDVCLRMRWSNKHLNGIISISRLLDTYYKNCNSILIPPLVDKTEKKWDTAPIESDDPRIKLCYVGSPGGGKDRLDYIVSGIKNCEKDSICLDVIGITKEQYALLYGEDKEIDNLPVVFWGRLPHNVAVSKLKESDFQIFFRENTKANNAGFPTKFSEAISAGVPVITNKTSNVSDFLISGENGYLIEDASADSISHVLNQVSHLSKGDVSRMKGTINSSTFDYHNYIVPIASFINNLMEA